MVNEAKTFLRSYTLTSRVDAVALVFHSMIIAQIWHTICYNFPPDAIFFELYQSEIINRTNLIGSNYMFDILGQVKQLANWP